MSFKIIIPPEEIITVEEAAKFMRVDFPDDEEQQIKTMITAARQWCEEYLRRAIGVQTLRLILDGFPFLGKQAIILRPPVIKIESVKYLDTNNIEQSLTLDVDYYLSIDTDPAELRPVSAWPVALKTADSVKIEYQSGYYAGGSPAVSVALPSTIKTAMLMQISDLYHNR